MNPTNRESFIEYCLRRLGKPVIEINVDADQCDDRVDDALRFYYDYHFDGTERIFLKHVVTEEDQENGYLPIPENIIGVVNIFDLGDALSTNNLFNIRYQISLNDLYDLSRYDIVPYYMNFQNIRLIEEILIGQQLIRYNRRVNKLHIDQEWDLLLPGQFIIADCYSIVDPDVYTDAWQDRWLLEYATNLIKKQWGSNLTKFTGLSLPGGVQFSAEKIYDDANAKIQELEAEAINNYSLPVSDLMG